MKLFPVAAVVCAVLISYSAPQIAFAAPASDEDLKAIRKSLEEIKASQADMNKQIQEIKGQLRPVATPARTTTGTPAAKPPPVMTVNNIPYEVISDGRTTGSKDAKVVMLEFSDLQCIFCANYHTNAFQRVMNDYVATGKIRYVFRDLPIPSHQHEMKFAQTTRCVADKGKFWEAHDYIFRHQDKTNSDNVTTQIAALGVDVDELNACVASGGKIADIKKDSLDAVKMGATGAPTLFVAVADDANKVKVVRKIRGGNYQTIKGVLDEVLAAATAKAKP